MGRERGGVRKTTAVQLQIECLNAAEICIPFVGIGVEHICRDGSKRAIPVVVRIGYRSRGSISGIRSHILSRFKSARKLSQ